MQALLDRNAAELVGVAAEYGLMELRKISEQVRVRVRLGLALTLTLTLTLTLPLTLTLT